MRLAVNALGCSQRCWLRVHPAIPLLPQRVLRTGVRKDPFLIFLSLAGHLDPSCSLIGLLTCCIRAKSAGCELASPQVDWAWRFSLLQLYKSQACRKCSATSQLEVAMNSDIQHVGSGPSPSQNPQKSTSSENSRRGPGFFLFSQSFHFLRVVQLVIWSPPGSVKNTHDTHTTHDTAGGGYKRESGNQAEV